VSSLLFLMDGVTSMTSDYDLAV